jgi:hypothetical protein
MTLSPHDNLKVILFANTGLKIYLKMLSYLKINGISAKFHNQIPQAFISTFN